MPARKALVGGELGEQQRRTLVTQREDGELATPIESDNDTRRPAAEPSPGVVEEQRSPQGCPRHPPDRSQPADSREEGSLQHSKKVH
jgi:hypothetical protein